MDPRGVWDGSVDPRGGLGQFVGPSWRFGTGRGTLGEVRVGWGDPRGGSRRGFGTRGMVSGRVGGPSGRSVTDRGTLEVVRVGWEDPQGCPGRVGELSGRSGMVRGTVRDVRDGSKDHRGGEGFGQVGQPARWSGSEHLRGGLGRSIGPSGRIGMGRGTLGKVRNGSGDPRGGQGRVRGYSRRSGTGLGTLGKVRDG